MTVEEPDLDEFFRDHFSMFLEAMDAGIDAAAYIHHASNVICWMATPMPQPQRKEFVMRGLDRHMELLDEQMADDAAFRRKMGIAPRRPLDRSAPPRMPRRQSSNGYVGRTVTRAVVWNVVNSIFRVFR